MEPMEDEEYLPQEPAKSDAAPKEEECEDSDDEDEDDEELESEE